MDNEIIREQIYSSFFKHAVWIDNQILDCSTFTATSNDIHLHFNYFSRIAEEFHNLGVSCLLKNYPVPPSRDVFDTSVNVSGEKTCLSLARNSDFIILDWYLYEQDCTFCLDFINYLTKSQRFHFIIILTNERVDLVSEQIPKQFQGISEDAFFDYAGHFVIIKSKSSYNLAATTSNTHAHVAQDLLHSAFNCLDLIYNDILHLLAFDFVGNIKEIVPTMLASIPEKTNLGLAADFQIRLNSLVASSNADISSAVEQNNDILNNQVASAIFNIVISDYFEDIKQSYFTNAILLDKASIITNLKDTIISEFNSPNCDLTNIPAKRTKLRKFWDKISDLAQTDTTLYSLIESHSAFASFCENISLHTKNQLSDTLISRGLVLSKDNTIFICISQSCDCIRKHDFLFLKSEQTPSSYSDNTKQSIYVRLQHKLYAIPLDASAIVSLNQHSLDKYEKIALLRKDIVDRIADKFFSYITRVGVDISETERILRNEK